VSLVTPTNAFAAPSGYTPAPTPPAPSPGGTAGGLAGTVVSSTTIQPSGGTGNATIGNATITVTVKAGTFTGQEQIVITNASSSAITPPGGTPVVTFGIGIFINGTKVSGTFPPITVTVTSPSITAHSVVDFVTSSGLTVVSGEAATNGSVTFTFTSDPIFEVATMTTASTASATSAAGGTSSGSAIPGATSGQTGKPFLLEGAAAVALIVIGALMLVGLRLRRRTA
jgi:hypothetical protein